MSSLRAVLVCGIAAVVVAAGIGPNAASAGDAAPEALTGTVESAVLGPLGDYDVVLYATGEGGPVEIGSTTSAADGTFSIVPQPVAPGTVRYLAARNTTSPPDPSAITLVSVLDTDAVADVVVNEATTVAAAFAMAQFTVGGAIGGPAPGLPNAASMARNLADVETGALGSVLLTKPNGGETRTRDTFNSLANAVAACLETATECDTLLDATTSPEGTRPDNTFGALVNVAHDPWHNIAEVFSVSVTGSTPYQPALGTEPPGWTLPLRFDGDGMSLDGPGNVEIDHRGHLWVNNNFTYSGSTDTDVCGSDLLFEFLPNGAFAPGSPHKGGGLAGAGFGIGRDLYGDIWVSNFGFASKGCADPPAANSVSQFRPDGTALSPVEGWTEGDIAWPQAIRSDDSGTIWTANCNTDSVTMFPDGDPAKARHVAGIGIVQPFDIAFSGDTTFVSGSANDTVAMLGPDGFPKPGSPISGPFLHTPMGLAADSQGNVWVANQGVAAPNCPDISIDLGAPSITLLNPDGTPAPGAPFLGGSLLLPWGITVDGSDNVWVADFGGQRVSQFCGVPATDCRPGTTTGDPISPDVEGYGSDALTRNTGLRVDPSGNVWLMNNFIQDSLVENPGGHEIVAFVGIAAPVQPAAPIPRPRTPSTPPSAPAATPTPATPTFTG